MGADQRERSEALTRWDAANPLSSLKRDFKFINLPVHLVSVGFLFFKQMTFFFCIQAELNLGLELQVIMLLYIYACERFITSNISE